MRNFEKLDAEMLLAINSPEKLFSKTPSESKREFRALAKLWHPDISRTEKASCVFAHIVHLHRLAQLSSITGNTSGSEGVPKALRATSGTKTFELNTGETFTFKFLTERTFELGSMHVGQHSVLFEIGHEFSDLTSYARDRINGLTYKNLDMAAEMSKFLPQIEDVKETANSALICIRKTPDQLLLSDVLSFYKTTPFPLAHAGWIINGLLNIACYLEHSRLTHNAISAETVFVSPLRHTVHLLGGWWYSTLVGQPFAALPNSSIQSVPPDIITSKVGDCRADFSLIKALLRDLVEASLVKTGGSDDECEAPAAMLEFLARPSRGRSVDDYKQWKYNVLPESFGIPKFIKWKLESADIYGNIS